MKRTMLSMTLFSSAILVGCGQGIEAEGDLGAGQGERSAWFEEIDEVQVFEASCDDTAPDLTMLEQFGVADLAETSAADEALDADLHAAPDFDTLEDDDDLPQLPPDATIGQDGRLSIPSWDENPSNYLPDPESGELAWSEEKYRYELYKQGKQSYFEPQNYREGKIYDPTFGWDATDSNYTQNEDGEWEWDEDKYIADLCASGQRTTDCPEEE